MQSIEHQTGQIRVVRGRENWRTWGVLLDGDDVGAIGRGGHLAVKAPPGEHELSIVYRGVPLNSITFPLAPGDVLEVKPRVVVDQTVGFFESLGPILTFRPPLAVEWAMRDTKTGQPSAGMYFARRQSPPSSVEVLDLYRTHTDAVFLAQESRVIDNSKSDAPGSRTIRLTREWTRTVSLDIEAGESRSVAGGVNLRVLTLDASVEERIKSFYHIGDNERREFVEEVPVTVAARTKSEIIFEWKELRQCGEVRLRSGDTEHVAPFHVVTGVTFDQRQVDL